MIDLTMRRNMALIAGAIALTGGIIGYELATWIGDDAPAGQNASGRKVLYWYDPMVPSQHFDKPGKSPFMDMQLVPKFADEAASAAGVAIDPARTQNLGLRTAVVELGMLDSAVVANGTISYNERTVAVVQARASGFVQRVYGHAPGDVVGAGAPLADVLVPEWAGAQIEYLASRRTGDRPLAAAARQRLALLGMPAGTIAAVERNGRVHNVVTVTIPVAGEIKTLGVRAGMTVAAGQTLAEVNGLGSVWLNAAVPEAAAGQLRVGQGAKATLAAFPGDTFFGRVAAILPAVEATSRTMTVRIELTNRGGRLRPGMFGQVAFSGSARGALLVPSEALIRTGARTMVMLAIDKGRYQAAEVQVGRDAGGKTEVLAGLAAGERVVVSGQFLLDSEASLAGIAVRTLNSTTPPAQRPSQGAYQASGRIQRITAASITINHGPVPALKWPAMAMAFRIESAALVRGFKAGDQVRFGFDQRPSGPALRSIARETTR